MKIKLTDSEWKIISLLWEQSPLTLMQMTSALYEDTTWSKHTIMTLLGRMEAKGAIHYTTIGRTKHFYPSIGKEETVVQEAESFLKKVFHGRVGLMINTMVNEKALSKEEIDELYNILKQAEEEET